MPVPQDVDYGLSTDQLFNQLDGSFGPRFNLRTEIDERCRNFGRSADDELFAAAGGADASVNEAPEESVAVLSREAVGPYDLVVLLPTSVGALREWLDSNSYQIPEAADATLSPYVEMGSAFVALKLLPSAGSGDVQPLKLSFGGDIPAVPIVPTSVAANPDMGIIVQLLGDARAVTTNYRHVTINEAAIDWMNGGNNYPDVVSQAVDEAGGQAFVTDFAGPHDDRIFLPTVSDATLERLRGLDDAEDGAELWTRVEDILISDLRQNDADFSRIALGVISVPESVDVNELLRSPWRFVGTPEAQLIDVDVEALIERIDLEINDTRESIAALFQRNPYLTRLYSTMSPEEMTLDPVFGWNRDLAEQSNIRTAVRRVRCTFDGRPDWDNATIETESGVRFGQRENENPNIIRRQAGETVRGFDLPAAATIEMQMPAGQTQVVQDNRPEIIESLNRGRAGGCACDVNGTDAPFAWLIALGLGGSFFRRRRGQKTR